MKRCCRCKTKRLEMMIILPYNEGSNDIPLRDSMTWWMWIGVIQDWNKPNEPFRSYNE